MLHRENVKLVPADTYNIANIKMNGSATLQQRRQIAVLVFLLRVGLRRNIEVVPYASSQTCILIGAANVFLLLTNQVKLAKPDEQSDCSKETTPL